MEDKKDWEIWKETWEWRNNIKAISTLELEMYNNLD